MLERPDIPDEEIANCLRCNFGIQATLLTFLPIGADVNTAVYRVVAGDGQNYFLKIRMGDFDEVAVVLSKHLHDQGIRQIIAPLETVSGGLWADLGHHKAILYPFVTGRDGYEMALTERHWVAFGTALRQIHSAPVPAVLKSHIPAETYGSQGREAVKRFLNRARAGTFADSIAAELTVFLQEKRAEILEIVHQAERLAAQIQAQPQVLVVCHSDLHAGNILIDAQDNLYIVDWDNPIQAPRERDLMYPGGAQGFTGHTAAEEVDLFFRGYGQTTLNHTALAYYRFERIVQDIAAFCEQIFLTTGGDGDRQQSLEYLASNFNPGGTIEAAYRAL